VSENIRNKIVEQRERLSRPEYRKWLQSKLIEYGIDRNKLLAVTIVVERTIGKELSRIGSTNARPFYKLFKEDNKPTRAWIYAAELSLWLKYNKYKAEPYVRSIVTHPKVKNQLTRDSKKQIPLNMLFPATRVNSDRLKDYSKHFHIWMDKRG
jgi:hypothetical protein